MTSSWSVSADVLNSASICGGCEVVSNDRRRAVALLLEACGYAHAAQFAAAAFDGDDARTSWVRLVHRLRYPTGNDDQIEVVSRVQRVALLLCEDRDALPVADRAAVRGFVALCDTAITAHVLPPMHAANWATTMESVVEVALPQSDKHVRLELLRDGSVATSVRQVSDGESTIMQIVLQPDDVPDRARDILFSASAAPLARLPRSAGSECCNVPSWAARLVERFLVDEARVCALTSAAWTGAREPERREAAPFEAFRPLVIDRMIASGQNTSRFELIVQLNACSGRCLCGTRGGGGAQSEDGGGSHAESGTMYVYLTVCGRALKGNDVHACTHACDGRQPHARYPAEVQRMAIAKPPTLDAAGQSACLRHARVLVFCAHGRRPRPLTARVRHAAATCVAVVSEEIRSDVDRKGYDCARGSPTLLPAMYSLLAQLRDMHAASHEAMSALAAVSCAAWRDELSARPRRLLPAPPNCSTTEAAEVQCAELQARDAVAAMLWRRGARVSPRRAGGVRLHLPQVDDTPRPPPGVKRLLAAVERTHGHLFPLVIDVARRGPAKRSAAEDWCDGAPAAADRRAHPHRDGGVADAASHRGNHELPRGIHGVG